MLIDNLIERLFAAEHKYKVEERLRRFRDLRKLTTKQLRVTGTQEELEATIRSAVGGSVLPNYELEKWVDEAEENGNQHIFVFDLTDLGISELTQQRAVSKGVKATTPTENAYSAYPNDRLTWHTDKLDRLVLKQVYTASYWQKNESESSTTADKEVIVRDRVKQRAVNMLVVDRTRKRAEIRIARVEGPHDSTTKALERFGAFVERISSLLDIERHLEPTPIWNAFFAIAHDRAEVVMGWDRAAESRLTVTLSNRLLDHGGDVRDHEDYRLDAAKWARKELRVTWLRGSGDDQERINVHLSEVQWDSVPIGKVEFYQSLSPDAVNYVIGRVRDFTSKASA